MAGIMELRKLLDVTSSLVSHDPRAAYRRGPRLCGRLSRKCRGEFKPSISLSIVPSIYQSKKSKRSVALLVAGTVKAAAFQMSSHTCGHETGKALISSPYSTSQRCLLVEVYCESLHRANIQELGYEPVPIGIDWLPTNVVSSNYFETARTNERGSWPRREYVIVFNWVVQSHFDVIFVCSTAISDIFVFVNANPTHELLPIT